MSQLENKLRLMGYEIPPPFQFPNPNRTGCVAAGSIVFVSGHGRDLPSLPQVKHAGKLGRDVTIEEGYATARAVALSILASLKTGAGRSRSHQAHRAAVRHGQCRRPVSTACPR